MSRTPIVFISYRAHSQPHGNWVRRLATDLRTHGVDAILDQWDLQVGNDLTQFMTDGITRADHVLLVCTPEYAERASAPGGGVAFEHWIMSGAIHTGAADPGKFLPVLRAGEPSASIPAYLANRYFVDFRDDLLYGPSLERILRFLFSAPLVPKPPVGTPPAYAAGGTQGTAGAAGEGRSTPPGSATPRAWVLVAGTGVEHRLSDGARAAAEALGALLARHGYGIVTSGWPGVDEIISRAFAREVSRLGLPLENLLTQVVEKTKLPAFPAGSLIFVDSGEAEWEESVRPADAVVLVGGLGGTYTTGRLGLERGKVVLPLADTGGDAKRLYTEMYRSWAERPVPGLDRERFARLGREAMEALDTLPELLELSLGARAGS